MSLAQQILASTKPEDTVTKALREAVEKVVDRRAAWLASRDKYRPTLDAFEVLGAHIGVDDLGCIDVRIAGDKELFVKCWKLWRELGIRLDAAAPGATSISQFVDQDGLRFYFSFSSTVCKRVKVGTKLVPTDVYETQCGEPLTVPELEANSDPISGALPPPDDNVPF